MESAINALKDTPIPTILVVGGMAFLLLAIAGQNVTLITVGATVNGSIEATQDRDVFKLHASSPKPGSFYESSLMRQWMCMIMSRISLLQTAKGKTGLSRLLL